MGKIIPYVWLDTFNKTVNSPVSFIYVSVYECLFGGIENLYIHTNVHIMSYAMIFWQGFFYKYTRLLCHFYLKKYINWNSQCKFEIVGASGENNSYQVLWHIYSTATVKKIVYDEGTEVASDNGAQVVCDGSWGCD